MNPILAESAVYLGSLFLILIRFIKKPWFVRVYLRYARIIILFELAMYFFQKQSLTMSILHHKALKVASFETLVFIVLAYLLLEGAVAENEEKTEVDDDGLKLSLYMVWFLALLQFMNVFTEWRTIWGPFVLVGIVIILLIFITNGSDDDSGFWSGYALGSGGK